MSTRKFYIQQVAATVAILTLWLCASLILSRIDAPPVPPEPTGQRIRHEARDERTNESARFHHFDENQTRTHMEVKFKDGSQGTVYYDLMGRPRRAEEKQKGGARLVFTFNRGQVARLERFRPDGKLAQVIVPEGKDGIRLENYAEDGSTRLLEARRRTRIEKEEGTGYVILVHSHDAVLYWEDGLTVRARYEGVERQNTDIQARAHKGTLTVFNKRGIRQSQEIIDVSPGGCGQTSCHECGGREDFEVTVYRQGGEKVWLKQTVSSEYGTTTIAGQELDAGGRLIRRLSTLEQWQGDASQKLEDLESGQVLLLTNEHQVVRETFPGPEGEEQSIEFHGKERYKLDLDLLKPWSRALELLPLLAPEIEQHRLPQMLGP